MGLGGWPSDYERDEGHVDERDEPIPRFVDDEETVDIPVETMTQVIEGRLT